MTPLTQIQAVVVTSVIANSITQVGGSDTGITVGGDGPGDGDEGDEGESKHRGAWDEGGLW